MTGHETTRERMDREEAERRHAQELEQEPGRRAAIEAHHAATQARATLMTEGEPTIAELLALTYARGREPACDTYWGSHGCDRPPGHELPHVCGLPEDDGSLLDCGLCTVHDGEGVRYIVVADDAGEIERVDEGRTPDRVVLGRHRYPSPTFSL